MQALICSFIYLFVFGRFFHRWAWWKGTRGLVPREHEIGDAGEGRDRSGLRNDSGAPGNPCQPSRGGEASFAFSSEGKKGSWD